MIRARFVVLVTLAIPWLATSQTFPTNDPVIKNIWAEAVDSSQLPVLAHELLDVVGPRLVGSPGMLKANDWAVKKLSSWSIEARNEQYGTWKGWERATTHIDLLEPRVRSLEGTMLAWSPGTKKGGVTAGTVILADVQDSIAFLKWLPAVKGKFVLASQPQATGRPDKNWEEFGLKPSFDSLKALRDRIKENWDGRIKKTGFASDTLPDIFAKAGAVGIITSRWSMGWGVNKVFGTQSRTVPVVDLSLEDYNLLYRLTEYGDNPIIRVDAQARFLGRLPANNTIGMIRGTEKPEEYIILSAHFDSWDAGSGATDNGTGSLLMMETMRVLKEHYPAPKRTIVIGLWGSEEQGLNGSRAFVKDHPEIVEKIHAVFNQDNGTGRITSIGMQGYLDAGEDLAHWLSRIPGEVTTHVKVDFPGMPWGGGSDHASFVAAGVPAFSLGSLNWDYFLYTWHTNRDTYDKLVFDDLKNNVVLTACLVYLAAEQDEMVSREKRVMPPDRRTGEPRPWPAVHEPNREGGK